MMWETVLFALKIKRPGDLLFPPLLALYEKGRTDKREEGGGGGEKEEATPFLQKKKKKSWRDLEL